MARPRLVLLQTSSFLPPRIRSKTAAQFHALLGQLQCGIVAGWLPCPFQPEHLPSLRRRSGVVALPPGQRDLRTGSLFSVSPGASRQVRVRVESRCL